MTLHSAYFSAPESSRAGVEARTRDSAGPAAAHDFVLHPREAGAGAPYRDATANVWEAAAEGGQQEGGGRDQPGLEAQSERGRAMRVLVADIVTGIVEKGAVEMNMANFSNAVKHGSPPLHASSQVRQREGGVTRSG